MCDKTRIYVTGDVQETYTCGKEKHLCEKRPIHVEKRRIYGKETYVCEKTRVYVTGDVHM